MAVLDEVWSLTQMEGEQLTQAVVPTQATRRRRQLWIVSTAGDDSSVWFKSWIDRGRAGETGIAYFEWSAPDDVDVHDPSTWAMYHPGFPDLIDMDAMAAARTALTSDEEYARAYLNRWPLASDGSFKAAWPTCMDTTALIPRHSGVAFGVDAAVDGKSAAIVAAAVLDDGRTGVELIDHRDGIDWVTGRVLELWKRHRCVITLQRVGPAGHLITDLERVGVPVRDCSSVDMAGATARFRQLTIDRSLAHLGHEGLDLAVEHAVTRQVGDRDTFWRRGSAVDISPLTAATLAVWAVADTPPAPVIMV